jgi:hypothetical protein
MKSEKLPQYISLAVADGQPLLFGVPFVEPQS